MQNIETKRIRNVALLGHSGSGKTSLVEALLHVAGASDRFGNITDGTTVCDYDPEEIKRGFSLASKVAPFMWKNTKINVLDTPGFLDFVGEVHQALRVADAALILVDGKAGIEVGTELAWDYARAAGLPTAFFINKFDDNEARFGRVLDSLHEKFGKNICPLTIPMVKDGKVLGAIDLIKQEAHVFSDKGQHSVTSVPEESVEAMEKYRDMLMEAVASTDEDLMMKYFEGEEITPMEALNAVHEGVIHGEIVPVLCGAATKLWGVWTLLDVIDESFPRHTAKKVERLESGDERAIEPEGETALFVFKTVSDPFVGKMSFFKVMNGTLRKDMLLKNTTTDTNEKMAHIYIVKGKTQTEVDVLCCGDIGMTAKLANTNTGDTLAWNSDIHYARTEYPEPFMAQSIAPLSKGDEDKISLGVTKLCEEDKTIRFENNPETHQLVLYGMGDMHISVIEAKLKSRFGVSVKLDLPKIAYREMITKRVQVQGKHKKQSGGHGQYGDVKIEFFPGEEEGLTFTESTVGGSVPKNFHPAVQKGLEDSMKRGVYGYPVIKLAANLFDGSYHDVDSNEMSFKMAANLAYKECMKLANPVLLEPVGDLAVTVPESYVGDVMSNLNKRRGSVMGMDPAAKRGYTTINATIPKAEILDYTITLRAMTQGRGSFSFTETGYEQVPMNIAMKIKEENAANEE
ncbi:MAG: elongation factor G [Clostridia bacterium]|nr:elongation factor G [Clostridia bacterium]